MFTRTAPSPSALPSPSPSASRRVPPVWLMVVAQLDRGQLEYTIKHLAKLLRIKPHTLRQYASSLWPSRGCRDHYRLDWNEACVLVNFAAYRSNKLKAPELFQQLSEAGLPLNAYEASPDATEALAAVHRFRQRRSALSKDI